MWIIGDDGGGNDGGDGGGGGKQNWPPPSHLPAPPGPSQDPPVNVLLRICSPATRPISRIVKINEQ